MKYRIKTQLLKSLKKPWINLRFLFRARATYASTVNAFSMGVITISRVSSFLLDRPIFFLKKSLCRACAK
jgi:hypothetical protein